MCLAVVGLAAFAGCNQPSSTPETADSKTGTRKALAADTIDELPAASALPLTNAAAFSRTPEVLLSVGAASPAVSGIPVFPEPREAVDRTSQRRLILFWATWCDPSVQQLNRLVHACRTATSAVELVAVSTESPAVVKSFLQNVSPERLDLTEAQSFLTIVSDETGESAAAWLHAAEHFDLPTLFATNADNAICWIGAPDTQSDQSMALILNGSMPVNQAAPEQIADQSRRDEIGQRHSSIMDATLLENYPEALQRTEELLQRFPSDPDFLWHRLQLLLSSGHVSEAKSLAETIAEKNVNQIPVLNQLAWWLANSTEPQSASAQSASELLQLAESFALRAVEQSSQQDAACLDTLARVRFLQGNLPEAIRMQQSAVSIAPDSKMLQTTLTEYQSAQQAVITPVGFETPR